MKRQADIYFRTQADLKYARRGVMLVRAVAEEAGMSREALGELSSAASEAITNAVKHGSPTPESHVGLTVTCDDVFITLTVGDEGTDFDLLRAYERIMAGTPEYASLDQVPECGMGLRNMARLVNGLRITRTKTGTMVTLTKALARIRTDARLVCVTKSPTTIGFTCNPFFKCEEEPKCQKPKHSLAEASRKG